MSNIELGQEVNALKPKGGSDFEPVFGKVTGIFCDAYGRQFVQIKPRTGNAVNVDRITVNASSEDRQRYMDVIKQVKEIEDSGNKEVEESRAAIVEACNTQINELYSSLSPFVDLSFEADETELDEEDEPTLADVAGYGSSEPQDDVEAYQKARISVESGTA